MPTNGTLTPDQQKLLDYYRRDAEGRGHIDPYGGLHLDRVRIVRATLARHGLLERTSTGRWQIHNPEIAALERLAARA